MNKHIIVAALLAAGLAAQPAHAQSFLKRMAGAAARTVLDKAPRPEDLAEKIATEALDAAASAKAKRTASGTGAGAETAPAPAPQPAPRPAKPRLPSDITPPSEAAAQKQRFLAFSRYACSDCEGGHGFDAWARLILNLTGNRAWEEKVGALGVGEAIDWRGRESDGTLTVTGENAVEGLRCKQVQWLLVRRSDQSSAGREGLFCFGRWDRYVTTEGWVEVY